MSLSKRNGQKPLSAQSKMLVVSLIKYFERERDNKGPLIPLSAVRERVSNALGIGMRTVSSISSAANAGKPITGPATTRMRKKRLTEISKEEQLEICKAIAEMRENGHDINADTILKYLKEKNLFKGEISTLRVLLKNIGFRFKRNEGLTPDKITVKIEPIIKEEQET